MFLGIPRGAFYYDYHSFIKAIFEDTDVNVIYGDENSDHILFKGSEHVADETCLPVKLAAGQIGTLLQKCDQVLVPRLMKDIYGRWYCPKILGLPETISGCFDEAKIMITDPICFNDKKKTFEAMRGLCERVGVDRNTFKRNFSYAYEQIRGQAAMHIEAGWEFVPEVQGPGEIILPNKHKVFLAGHSYNLYDRFANNDIVRRLDELCIEAVTECSIKHDEMISAVERLGLIKAPFWGSVIRTLGSAVCLKDQIDGIVYLSSFSCGPDAFIIELIREYVPDIPMMVLKLDGHKGTAGLVTRLEAFADMLERREKK